MSTQSLSTSLAPEVVITQVSGDLTLKGWDKPEITVVARQEDLTLEEQDDVVHLSCRGNCEVRTPQGASLQIQSVQGNAHLKLLDEPITVGVVEGSLTLRNVAATQVEVVHGNLSIRRVSGDFQASQVKGNAEIRKVQGNCCLEEVQGKLDGWDVEGEVRTHAQGNVYLRLNAMHGVDYQIHSEGNVQCYVPEDASLKLVLSSRGEMIKIRLGEEASTVHQAHYELTVNGGATSLMISSGGSIYLLSRKPEWGEEDEAAFETDLGYDPEEFSRQIAQQVKAQIQAQMEMVTGQLNEEMSRITERIGETGLSPEETNLIMEQVRRTSERETARAQDKMRRAQEKLERKLEAARRRHERRAEEFDRRTRHGKHSWSFQWPTPPSQSQPSEKEAVSEEERLMILRMLEQKKITLEEADKLLAALEGKEE